MEQNFCVCVKITLIFVILLLLDELVVRAHQQKKKRTKVMTSQTAFLVLALAITAATCVLAGELNTPKPPATTHEKKSNCSAALSYDECVELPGCSTCCNWNNYGPNCTETYIGCYDKDTEQCCTGNGYGGSLCPVSATCCMGWAWSLCCSAGTQCCSDMHSFTQCLSPGCYSCMGDCGGAFCPVGTTCTPDWKCKTSNGSYVPQCA